MRSCRSERRLRSPAQCRATKRARDTRRAYVVRIQLHVLTWNGLIAPAGTPKDIINKIVGELGRAANDPQFVARLEQYGADPLSNTPEAFAALIAADLAVWSDVIKSTGLKF
jgi:tripartite-type tricarboxylate transporter receptor subunit TctC